MSSGYVWAGYGITIGTLALYTARVLRRGRVLSRSVAVDDRALPTDGPAGGEGR